MSQNEVSQKPKPREARWTDIYTQLQEDNVEFFLNTHLDPTVLIPNDGFQTEWPVDSQRFKDLLLSVFYEISNGRILKSSECDFLMAQIREECRKGGRRLTDSEAAETDQDLMVQAILYLVNSMPKDATASVFNGRTVLLQKRFEGFQKEGAIPCYPEIPTFTNIFSRRLARLVPVLRGYGVQIDLSHAEDGSRCKLTRLETFKFEPNSRQVQPSTDGWKSSSSGQSSVVSSVTGSQIQHTDGTDDETRFEEPNAKSLLALPQPNGSVLPTSNSEAVSGTKTPVAASEMKGGAK